ncbi:MAG: peptidoglycan-binding protein, partial [Salaquimonas sp.]
MANFAQATNEQTADVIKAMFDTGKLETGSSHLNSRAEELKAFYENRSFKPIWVRDDGPKGKAKALLIELERSVVHGLKPDYYGVSQLNGLMAATNPTDLAKLEMHFSGALIDYGYDLSNGRTGYQSMPEQVQIKPIIRSITQVLEGAEKAGELRNFVSSLLNVDDRYIRLVSKIAEIKRAKTSGIWPIISGDLDELKLGSNHPEIAAIKTFLLLMGDFLIAEYSENTAFDPALMQAIKSFQSRQGFEITGILDRRTLDEISRPVDEVIEKISLNLERRRWQNSPIGASH